MWGRRDGRCRGSSGSFPKHEVLPYRLGLETTLACRHGQPGDGRGVEEPAAPCAAGLVRGQGVGQRSVLASLPPCLAISRMRGWQAALGTEPPHATRAPQAPPSFPLLPAFAPARSGAGMAPLPSGRDLVLGGLSLQGPACSLGSCNGQLPCAQPLPHAVYGHFLNTVFILTSL